MQVPHYYVQNFGSAVSHPDTNEYAAFAQDMIRVTDHFDVSLGVRYDLQTFSTKYLKTNPLWPDSGKVPFNPKDFAPRVGLSYSIGDRRPLVARVGYGLFYPRIPQIYNSTIETQNGLTPNSIFLNQTNYLQPTSIPAISVFIGELRAPGNFLLRPNQPDAVCPNQYFRFRPQLSLA